MSPPVFLSVLLPTVGILVSESFVYAGQLPLALSGHLLTLFVCLLAPLRLREGSPVFQAFALVPLFRLVNLGMPVFVELTLYWFPLIYGPLIPAAFLLTRNTEIGLGVGWQRTLLLLPPAIGLSVVLANVEYLILRPNALIPTWDPGGVVVITVVMVGFVGAAEELVFRGVLQSTLQAQLNPWSGILLASVVYGLMHSGYAVPAELGFAFLSGLLFGYIYYRTRSLGIVILIHGVMNVCVFAVFPFLGPLFQL